MACSFTARRRSRMAPRPTRCIWISPLSDITWSPTTWKCPTSGNPCFDQPPIKPLISYLASNIIINHMMVLWRLHSLKPSPGTVIAVELMLDSSYSLSSWGIVDPLKGKRPLYSFNLPNTTDSWSDSSTSSSSIKDSISETSDIFLSTDFSFTLFSPCREPSFLDLTRLILVFSWGNFFICNSLFKSQL